MEIRENWWKNFFNEIYLITDARSICNSDLTSQEASLIEKILGLKKFDQILDLCGGYGRHSLELARRGYLNLTVLDYSDFQIKRGKQIAKNESLEVKYVRADARMNRLKNNYYNAIILMANSFGYFIDENKNYKILKEANRLLKKDGKLLLDLTDPGYIKNNLKPFSWHAANQDVIVLRKRKIANQMIRAREIVISKSKGLLRDAVYCERIYSKERIFRLLKKARFKNLSAKNNLILHKPTADYGLLNSRMFVTAIKE